MKDIIKRRKAKVISVGGVKVGSGHPITIQSMTKTNTSDSNATLKQIKALESAGCEIVRVSIPDQSAVTSLKSIRDKIKIPLIADIHFDYRLALLAVDEVGVDCLRINPGNIGGESRVRAVVKAAKGANIPIRIGVNSGSLEKEILKRHGGVTPEAMVESGLSHIKILEDLGFYDIKISLKGSDVIETISAYRLMAKKVDYPFHIGITEAGTIFSGTIKSSVGLGILLMEGLGDTIRVSLSGDPVEEVRVGFEIVKSLGIRKRGINIISCPTCSRQEIDVVRLSCEIEKRFSGVEQYINIAVMGCAVNGPGEAKRCDIGIAGGKGIGVIFKNGEIKKKVPEGALFDALMDEISVFIKERR